MIWFPLFIFSFIISIICYLTNPIVLLFADERGELHGYLNFWQTWDDSCDVEWFVKEEVPAVFRYDFDKHYISSREITALLDAAGRDKGCVICINSNFTIWERIQRYFCRLLWLTRNCSYGFSFWLLGIRINGYTDTYVKKQEENYTFLIGKDKNIFTRPWMLKDDRYLFSAFGYDVYNKHFLGWKIDNQTNAKKQAMIANRIALKFVKK